MSEINQTEEPIPEGDESETPGSVQTNLLTNKVESDPSHENDQLNNTDKLETFIGSEIISQAEISTTGSNNKQLTFSADDDNCASVKSSDEAACGDEKHIISDEIAREIESKTKECEKSVLSDDMVEPIATNTTASILAPENCTNQDQDVKSESSVSVTTEECMSVSNLATDIDKSTSTGDKIETGDNVDKPVTQLEASTSEGVETSQEIQHDSKNKFLTKESLETPRNVETDKPSSAERNDKTRANFEDTLPVNISSTESCNDDAGANQTEETSESTDKSHTVSLENEIDSITSTTKSNDIEETSQQQIISSTECQDNDVRALQTEDKSELTTNITTDTSQSSSRNESDKPTSMTRNEDISHYVESTIQLEPVSPAEQNPSGRESESTFEQSESLNSSKPHDCNIAEPVLAEEKSDVSFSRDESSQDQHNEQEPKTTVDKSSHSNSPSPHPTEDNEEKSTQDSGLDTSIEIISVENKSKCTQDSGIDTSIENISAENKSDSNQEKQPNDEGADKDHSSRYNCVEISSCESENDSCSEKYDSDEVYCVSDDEDLICLSDKKNKQKKKDSSSMSYQCGEVTYSIITESLSKNSRSDFSGKSSSLEPNITIQLIPNTSDDNKDKTTVPVKENGSIDNHDDSIWLISDDEIDEVDNVDVTNKRKHDPSINGQVDSSKAKKAKKDSDCDEEGLEANGTDSNVKAKENQPDAPTQDPDNNASNQLSKESSNEVEVLSVSDDSFVDTDARSEKDIYDESSISSGAAYSDDMMEYTYNDPIYVESDSDKESTPSSIQITSISSSVSLKVKDSAGLSSNSTETADSKESELVSKESKEQNIITSSVSKSSPPDLLGANISTVPTASQTGDSNGSCQQSSEVTDSAT